MHIAALFICNVVKKAAFGNFLFLFLSVILLLTMKEILWQAFHLILGSTPFYILNVGAMVRITICVYADIKVYHCFGFAFLSKN